MLKRIGNLTVANNGLNMGAYYNPTPYRSFFVGLCRPNRTWFGRSRTPGVWAFVVGPLVVGRYDLQDALSGKQVQS